MRMNLLALMFLLTAYGCEFYDFRLKVVNKSGSYICVQNFENVIPDPSRFNHADHYLQSAIPPNTTLALRETGRNGWIESIDYSHNKKLNLFVFKIDSLKKYRSMEYLIDNRIYTLYTFSKEELEKSNWEVVVK